MEAQAQAHATSGSDPGLTLKGLLGAGGGQKALAALAGPQARCPATPSWRSSTVGAEAPLHCPATPSWSPPLWGLRPLLLSSVPQTPKPRHPQGSGSHRIDSPISCSARVRVMDAGAADWPDPWWEGPSHSKWRTRGATIIPPGASADTEVPPLPSLWCPHHLQALRDSHLQVKEAQDRPASALPTGTCRSHSARMGTTRAGPGTTRGGVRQHEGTRPCPTGRGFSSMNRAKVTEGGWPGATLLTARLPVAFKSFPLGGQWVPQEALGSQKTFPWPFVWFQKRSHGSMTHFRAAELQKLSACVAPAGPLGPPQGSLGRNI